MYGMKKTAKYNTKQEKRHAYYLANKEQVIKKTREWATNNPGKVKEYKKKGNQRLRKIIFEYYGMKCVCCGETEYKFLSIDHIEGGGNKHRKSLGFGASTMYSWLKKNNFPKGFQVLCHNCNQAKGFYGKCPHVDKQG